jgi:hypothetical protein
MNRKKITTLTILVLIISTAIGQSYEPFDLAKKIFSQDAFPNIKNYSTGEYNGEPNGQDLQQGVITKFTLLGQTEKNAVVGMTLLDSTGKGVDTYLYFEKDSIWKMSAFRELALTGMVEQVVQYLEKMTSLQIDEMIEKSKKEKDAYGMFESREDYDFELGNARLIIGLDDNLVKHFLANQLEFERIKNLALKQLETTEVDEENSIRLVVNLKKDYRKLFISSVSTDVYGSGNVINFLIGGMVDNSVGYIYVKDKKYLPEMSPDRIIMIKEIGNGWYIYKTT